MKGLGEKVRLEILRDTDYGLYLKAELDVLLPKKYVTDSMVVGEDVEVFLYRDSEDRPVAVTDEPLIMRNECVLLEAVAVNKAGAFFSWGMEKDLLVPYALQTQDIKVGSKYPVFMYLDEVTERLVGSMKIKPFLCERFPEVEKDDEVSAEIIARNELGYVCIINKKYFGLLYENLVYEELHRGEIRTVFVDKIREDNKLDVSLYRTNRTYLDEVAEMIENKIRIQGGKLLLTDKSSPELIKDELNISKKIFKKAVGKLYKERKVQILDNAIVLIK